jgi:hypothetical protein
MNNCFHLLVQERDPRDLSAFMASCAEHVCIIVIAAMVSWATIAGKAGSRARRYSAGITY